MREAGAHLRGCPGRMVQDSSPQGWVEELDSLALAALLVAVENETGRHIGFGLDFTPATTVDEALHTLNAL